MSRLEQGGELDGFRIGPLLHAGAMARIYQISYADGIGVSDGDEGALDA
jgi:hypothetical protein